MSRIYDALRKAEEEKQNQPDEMSSVTRSMIDAVVPEPGVATRLSEEPREVAPAVPEPDARPRTAIMPKINAEWSPEAVKLPALSASEMGSDEFRRLRTRLYQYRDVQPLRSLLITSGLPGEGKTFVASNLAVCLARHSDCRVLLIDGDLRNPNLHTIFGAPQSPGLSDYLAGHVSVSQVLQHGSIPNLSFIAGGTVAANSAELAGNRYMEHLIASVCNDFDWVITDSAPVIPVPDSIALARACDGVIIVARSANTPYDIAQRAVKEFAGSRVIGFVLNAVTGRTGRYGYNYDKGYGYGVAKAQAVGAK